MIRGEIEKQERFSRVLINGNRTWGRGGFIMRGESEKHERILRMFMRQNIGLFCALWKELSEEMWRDRS